MSDDDMVDELLGLLHRTSEGMTRLGQRMAEASRSHPTDLAAISLLARGRGRLTLGELGGELGLSKAATTNLVDRLEEAGHVHRVRDTTDRRRWHLDVTPAAHDLAASVLRDFLGRTRAALTDYRPDELAVVQRFLIDVAEALENQQPLDAGVSETTGPTDAGRSAAGPTRSRA